MRFFAAPAILSTFLVVALLGDVVTGAIAPAHAALAKRRRGSPFGSSIFGSPKGQSGLPSLQNAAGLPGALNLNNIQSDILTGVKKKKELFFFFKIVDPFRFKGALSRDIKSRITTVSQLLDPTQQPDTAVNIAFSQSGLSTLGVKDNLRDGAFAAGQAADASSLGDPGTSRWVQAFDGTNVHGVMLLASDTDDKISAELSTIQGLFGPSISEAYRLQAAARPGDQEGHEHFGYLDGISQPALDGFTQANPGQTVVPPGVIIIGERGDTNTKRPKWTKDGSFLAFRQLQQFVPEFNQFLDQNAIAGADLTHEQGAALLGARMFGRFKSGAPIDLTPRFDDPALGADPTRNNDFNFMHPGMNVTLDQTRCPFSAHIRKTNPRGDIIPQNTANQIMRSSIPYGPELTPDEIASKTTSIDRGLAFVSYQSDLSAGFRFQQQVWADNTAFPFGKNTTNVGFDPIIGGNQGNARPVSGLDPNDASREITIATEFVKAKGGEYFFTPPVDALSGRLAQFFF
ncbi:dye-decolorizing peroxidase precursor [Hysterangium stoloniferum]|nr:dye-decolorizing peroxidase precursor [Hysterangium stoloniferum]